MPTTEPTTSDPPTLAEKLRNCASLQRSTTDMKALHQVADTLDRLNPRILVTAEALAAINGLPDGCTVEMDSIGDVFVLDHGKTVARVAPTLGADGYVFAGGKYERLDEAVLVAWVRTRPSVGAGR